MATDPKNGKRPIDRQREAGGKFSIGNVDDGTPIREFIQIAKSLHAITDLGIYEIKLADQIDPERTNPNLPQTVHRQVLSVGLRSDLVCRVLLQAKALLDEKFLRPGIDCERGLVLAFEALEDMVALSATSSAFAEAERDAAALFEQRKQDGRSRASR